MDLALLRKGRKALAGKDSFTSLKRSFTGARFGFLWTVDTLHIVSDLD